jgi:hypothetical protein
MNWNSVITLGKLLLNRIMLQEQREVAISATTEWRLRSSMLNISD